MSFISTVQSFVCLQQFDLPRVLLLTDSRRNRITIRNITISKITTWVFNPVLASPSRRLGYFSLVDNSCFQFRWICFSLYIFLISYFSFLLYGNVCRNNELLFTYFKLSHLPHLIHDLLFGRKISYCPCLFGNSNFL